MLTLREMKKILFVYIFFKQRKQIKKGQFTVM